MSKAFSDNGKIHRQFSADMQSTVTFSPEVNILFNQSSWHCFTFNLITISNFRFAINVYCGFKMLMGKPKPGFTCDSDTLCSSQGLTTPGSNIVIDFDFQTFINRVGFVQKKDSGFKLMCKILSITFVLSVTIQSILMIQARLKSICASTSLFNMK